MTNAAQKLAGLLYVAVVAVAAGLWWTAARGESWVAAALRSPLSIRCGLILLFGAAVLAVLVQMMSRLGRPPRVWVGRDRRGVAMLEFVLLFPIAMAVILIMTQSAMLMSGNLVVHYAAFSAARSAVAWVPRDMLDQSGEPRNVVRLDGEKRAKITEAAVLALLPAAGAPSTTASACPVGRVAGRVYEGFHGRQMPDAWSRQYARRYAYASDADHTWIEMSTPTWTPTIPDDDAADGRLDGEYNNGTSLDAYGPREDIRVTVHHRFYLSVPYANAIFGDPLDDRPGAYATEIVAGYTLVNQGRYDDVVDEFESGPDSNILLPH